MANKAHAKLLLERGHADQAGVVFMQALTEDFNDAEALAYLGNCFLASQQYGSAANMLARAAEALLQEAPGQQATAEVLTNLGACYKLTNRADQAETFFKMALQHCTGNRKRAEVMKNIASRYINNGTPEKAREMLHEALKLCPDHQQIAFDCCWPELELGNWKEGFALYDLGFQAGTRRARTYEGIPAWRGGESLAGKTVIVWGDQGIGDEIMHASCIPDLMAEAKEVIFDCHPRLQKLFERSFGIKCHGTRKTGLGEWHYESGADVSIPLTTLATIYRSDGQFPGTTYLYATGHRPTRAKRIGISWSGGTTQTRNDLRTVPLIKEWAPLLRSFGDAEVYSLQYQKETAAQEVCEMEEASGIHIRHYPGKVQCDDYSVTADFVAGLDLVISVCTSIVHLSGALGVPCWCLVPSKPAWRYGVKGDRMPWYGSVRLFRQSGDDWSSVFEQVREAYHGESNAIAAQ